jgi:hypothetical protein
MRLPFGLKPLGRKKGGVPSTPTPIRVRPTKSSPPKTPKTPKTRGQAPMDQTDQTDQRRRRRASMTVVYTGAFDFGVEVAAIAEPLGQRVAAARQPLLFRSWVVELADAAHELVSTVVGWLAESDALAKTEHLADEPGKRRFAMTTLRDLAQRPALPEIADDMLLSGGWAAQLITMAAPSAEPLAALLARSWPPNAEALRGRLSRSERLNDLLRNTIDRAALALERRLDWAESAPSVRLRPTEAARTEQARAELAAMGVQL